MVMVRFKTGSLFETTEVDSRLRGNDKGVVCSHIIRVAFESAADNEFDYAAPDELWPIQAGQRVEVPFGKKNKPEVGFCVEADIAPDNSFIWRGKGRSLKQVAISYRQI